MVARLVPYKLVPVALLLGQLGVSNAEMGFHTVLCFHLQSHGCVCHPFSNSVPAYEPPQSWHWLLNLLSI